MSLFRKLVGIFQAAGVALRKRLLGGLPPVFVEDVFSTWLYTGNDSTQTITNGIDLSTKGGLVWMKSRTDIASHALYDTVRGATKELESQSSNAQTTRSTGLTAFNSNGFSIGSRATINSISQGYASWTFRKQPKFFDVVTYTGDNATSRNITHNLGSTPGCIIVKNVSLEGEWVVYHRSTGTGKKSYLNLAFAVQTDADAFASVTSTTFSVSGNNNLNTSPDTYVAYLFAHDAGGFGLTGTDNVISCGGFTVSGGATTTINLGYEPQWILTKRADTTSNWELFDTMRGLTVDFNNSAILYPNLSNVETAAGGTARIAITSTGFRYNPAAQSDQIIYIAIRKGPMKVPTSGAGVFQPVARTGTGATATVTNSSISYVDFLFSKMRNDTAAAAEIDRLRGNGYFLYPAYTDAESNPTGFPKLDVMNGYTTDSVQNFNQNAKTFINYLFKRAPSFLDVVCYTGTNPTPQNINHNLGVAPELMIVKVRSVSGDDWAVYCSKVTDANIVNLRLNKTQAIDYNGDMWDATTPTATTFRVGQSVLSNYGGQKLVAYLFATCAGVSKVGSYTGTAALQTVNCGFTSGARFVMIKRTDTTGAWYYYDSARGISSGDDPYLIMNTDAVEVTNTNYVDTDTTGFKVTAAAPADLNASGGTYIFLAIA